MIHSTVDEETFKVTGDMDEGGEGVTKEELVVVVEFIEGNLSGTGTSVEQLKELNGKWDGFMYPSKVVMVWYFIIDFSWCRKD